MATETKETFDDERPSGVPRRGELGESKKELWALLGATAVIILIIVAFWLQARP